MPSKLTIKYAGNILDLASSNAKDPIVEPAVAILRGYRCRPPSHPAYAGGSVSIQSVCACGHHSRLTYTILTRAHVLGASPLLSRHAVL